MKYYHAHFDTFSGAAGDMLLAACLDAADSLPRSLPLGRPPSTDDDGVATKNSDKLLSQVVHDLECGMPEMKGEFKLSVKRVWRGMGKIAAKKVDVQSIYNHEAAPVPGATTDDVMEEAHSHKHVHQHRHDHHHSSLRSNVDDGRVMKEELSGYGDTHDHSHDHAHSHDHSHAHHDHSHDHLSGSKLRNLAQIKKMLSSAPPQHIPPHVAVLAIESFTALAHAEMYTHGAESIDQVHFHEVGAVDSIVDTIGTLLALHYLGVDLGGVDRKVGNGRTRPVTCAPLPLGEGTVWTDHGLLPTPAPATVRLMVGMPTCPGPKGVTGELVTPTAAALLRVLTGVSSGSNIDNHRAYWTPKALPGRPPSMIPRAIGVGAGRKDFERHPNVLRLILGEDMQHNVPRHSSMDAAKTGEKNVDVIIKDNDQESYDGLKKASESLDSAVEGKNRSLLCQNYVPVIMNNASKTNVKNESRHMKQTPPLWDMHSLTHLQANIDDATPELLAHAVDLLLNNGAIDAWIHPIVMKKGRPAHCLHCICHCEAQHANTVHDDSTKDADSGDAPTECRLLEIIFRHTTTLGIRIQRNILRATLTRKLVEVQLPYTDNTRGGKVDVKISSLKNGEVVSVKAEFDPCKCISIESSIPLKIVTSTAERLAWDNHISPYEH